MNQHTPRLPVEFAFAHPILARHPYETTAPLVFPGYRTLARPQATSALPPGCVSRLHAQSDERAAPAVRSSLIVLTNFVRMSTQYLTAIAAVLRKRLARISAGSDEAEELVLFVCDEIIAAFGRGELMALSHLQENAAAQDRETAQSTTP